MFGFRKEAAFSPENPQAYDTMVRAAEMQGQLRATPYEYVGTTHDGQIIQSRTVAIPKGYEKSASRFRSEKPSAVETVNSTSSSRVAHGIAALAIASITVYIGAFPTDGMDPNVQGKAANISEGLETVFGMVKGQLGG